MGLEGSMNYEPGDREKGENEGGLEGRGQMQCGR